MNQLDMKVIYINYYQLYQDNLKLEINMARNSIRMIKSVGRNKDNKEIERETQILRVLSWHPVLPKFIESVERQACIEMYYKFIPGDSLGESTTNYSFKSILIIAYGLFHALMHLHYSDYMIRTLGIFYIILDSLKQPHFIYFNQARKLPTKDEDSITNLIGSTETAPELCRFLAVRIRL